MVYSDIYFKKQNKFSVILAVMAGLSIFSFTLFFFGSQSAPATRASKQILKKHLIVNLTTNQVGIFWQTEKKELGWIVYGEKEDSVNAIVLDERDLESKKTPSYYHYVLLKNLDKDKIYYYKIVSANEILGRGNNSAFSFMTAKGTNASVSIKPTYGKVTGANGEPAQNAFILLHYPDAFPLLTLAKSTGEWLIPLQVMINQASMMGMVANEKERVRFEIMTENLSQTIINAPLHKSSPFPQTIVVGKDYDFSSEEEVLAATTINSASPLAPIDIVFPKEGAIIPAVRPLLKGVALPKKEVSLLINSHPRFAQKVITDNKGQWKSEVSMAIAPGTYILLMTTEDDKGKEVKLQRNFVVAKSGEQVLGDATGSAIPTPTSTVQEYPTATPTISVISPTPPVSGIDNKIFMYASVVLMIMGAGFLIVF